MNDGLLSSVGLKPAKIDKHGPMYDAAEIESVMMKGDANNRQLELTDKQKDVVERADKAISTVNTRIEVYRETNAKWKDLSDDLFASIKKTESHIKNQSERMAQFMQRLNKDARLEQVIEKAEAIERIANALERISELEKSGALTKVCNLLAGK